LDGASQKAVDHDLHVSIEDFDAEGVRAALAAGANAHKAFRIDDEAKVDAITLAVAAWERAKLKGNVFGDRVLTGSGSGGVFTALISYGLGAKQAGGIFRIAEHMEDPELLTAANAVFSEKGRNALNELTSWDMPRTAAWARVLIENGVSVNGNEERPDQLSPLGWVVATINFGGMRNPTAEDLAVELVQLGADLNDVLPAGRNMFGIALPEDFVERLRMTRAHMDREAIHSELAYCTPLAQARRCM
jgi:hypothetical protein